MTVRNIKTHLNLLEIFDKNQLDSNDIDYWWQKKFKDTQSNKNISSYEEKQKLLIEINRAKDELNEIDVEIIKNILNENQNNNYKSSNNTYSDSDSKDSENINRKYNKRNTSNEGISQFISRVLAIVIYFYLKEYFGINSWQEYIVFILLLLVVLWIVEESFK